MRYLKYIIAIGLVTILSKLFIYTYAYATSSEVIDYENWDFVSYDQAANNYYVDPNSFKKKDGLLIFKELTDFSSPNEYGKSRVSWLIADCPNLKISEIMVSFYSQSGGEGEEISSQKLQKKDDLVWMDASVSKTVGNLIISYVCNQVK